MLKKKEQKKHLFKSILIFIMIIVIFISLYYFYNGNIEKNENNINIKKVCMNDICVDVEIADTKEKRQNGLMNRLDLKDNEGMLFIFQEEEKHIFWMKNTLISLDIIWINKDLKIVDIQSVNPCETLECEFYEPREIALYVLEVNKGFSVENNIFIGNNVEFVE